MNKDSMAEHHGTRLEVETEKTSCRKTYSACNCNSAKNSPRNDRSHLRPSSSPSVSPSQNVGIRNTRTTIPLENQGGSTSSAMNDFPPKRIDDTAITKVELSPVQSRPQVKIVDTEEDGPDIGRIRNYQIKSVKKGVPTIDPKDDSVQRILLKKKDLKIIPYWVCQRQKEGMKRNATAWAFSTFVTFICLVFPLLSFSSDVAFYVTCSDHYNHTAQILEEVQGWNKTNTYHGTGRMPGPTKTITNQSGIKTLEIQQPASSAEVRPAPLKGRQKKSLFNVGPRPKWRTPIQFVSLPGSVNDRDVNQQFAKIFPGKLSFPRDATSSKPERKVQEKSIQGNTKLQESNFEVEIQEYNETSCDPVPEILRYMRSNKAAEELEAHRHVTIDIFEPVFILGSFPSLILCVLTRLVVLVTGHKNFLSAYFINVACMPLQLITGALSVHSASYHLGKKGFECWHCALEGDCSNMAPLWWLNDGVTKTLLVSILTKILDGMAGGVVLFVVIIRRLWPEGGHATFWWNAIRAFVIFAAFVSCIGVSPLLVITPAMSVLRLEFMELATPFEGRETISFALMVLMGLGIATWCLSFAVLFIHVSYSMYLYCRARTIDH